MRIPILFIMSVLALLSVPLSGSTQGLDIEGFDEAKLVQLIKDGETAGLCTSSASCIAVCTRGTPAQDRACYELAKKNNIVGADELLRWRAFVKAGSAIPNACSGYFSCIEYCSEASHADTCVTFAREHDLISEAEAAELVIADGPGGCDGADGCTTYCTGAGLPLTEQVGRRVACLRYVVTRHFFTKHEARMAMGFMTDADEVGGPGGCKSWACLDYCDPSGPHAQECLDYGFTQGVRHGPCFIDPDPLPDLPDDGSEDDPADGAKLHPGPCAEIPPPPDEPVAEPPLEVPPADETPTPPQMPLGQGASAYEVVQMILRNLF